MSLQKQIVPIQLGDGLDTKTDPKQVIPGKMLVLENCSLQALKKYKKRNGFSQLAKFNTTASGFITRKNDLLAFGTGTVQKYDANKGQFIDQSLSQIGLSYDSCRISSSSTTSGAVNTLYYDSCISNNVRLVAWVDSKARLKSQLFNVSTGASLSGLILGATNTDTVKTITVGNYLVAIYSQGSNITIIAYDSTDPTLTLIPFGVVITDLNSSSGVFDICALSTSIYLAYFNTLNGITIQILNPDLSFGAKKVFLASDATFGIGIAPDTVLNELWVSYVPTGTDNAKYFVVDKNLTTILASTNFAATSATLRVENPCIYVSNGVGKIFYDISQNYTGGDSNVGFLYTNHSYKQQATRTGTLSTLFDLKNSVSILSKPFNYKLNGNTVLCIVLGYNGHAQGYGFVVNEFGYILAKIGLNGIAAGYLYDSYNHLVNSSTNSFASVPSVSSLSDTVITLPILEQSAIGSDPNISGGFSFSYGVTIITLNFNSLDNLQFVESASETHITGGFLGHYDGSVFSENGFMTIPEPPQRITAFTGAGTNYFKAGTYQWVLVYEWFDAQNNFHQSAVSAVTKAVFASDKDQVSILINPNSLSFSPKADQTFLSIYGTQINGSIFYRLTAVPTNITSSVTDNYNVGAGRTGYPQLYTTGGEVDNDPMPSASAIFKYRNRIFIVPSETPNTLWYSKSEIQGIPGVPIAFSSVFTYQVNTSFGNTITGIQIDDKAILFKPSAIFVFFGDGPNDTGTGSDFTPATQVSSPVGTAEPRSVVGFQGGAIFKSLQGWYLIDRSLNVSYIGAEVEAYNSNTVVNSVLLPDSTEIRIILSSGDTLMYDWLVGKWSVHKNNNAVSASVFNSKYTRMLSTGELLQKDSSFSDNGQYITMKFQTSWLSFAGLQGFQRVYKLIILGDYVSAHALRVSIQYDFDPNTFQTIEFTPSSYLSVSETYGSGSPYGTDSPDNVFGGVSFANFPSYQWRFFTAIQKCESIQITIEEIQSDGIGEGFSLSGLAFEVGVEGGVQRLPAVKSFG